jgi:hypothetical protein
MTMSKTQDGANIDAGTFDLDRWIDDVIRPELTIELYPFEAEYAAKVAAIEAQIPAAEKTDPGLDDATPETLLAQLQELRSERSRTALKVRVRQLLDAEVVAIVGEVGEQDPSEVNIRAIAAACVAPTFTVDQLKRLRVRDLSGESMVAQLLNTVNGLMVGLPVPLSPAS